MDKKKPRQLSPAGSSLPQVHEELGERLALKTDSFIQPISGQSMKPSAFSLKSFFERAFDQADAFIK